MTTNVAENTKHDDDTTDDDQTPLSASLKSNLADARNRLDDLAQAFDRASTGTTDPDQVTIFASIAGLVARLSEAQGMAFRVEMLELAAQKAPAPASVLVADVHASAVAALDKAREARTHLDDLFRDVSSDVDEVLDSYVHDYAGGSQALVAIVTELENIAQATVAS